MKKLRFISFDAIVLFMALTLLVFAVTACAQLGLKQPQSFDQKLAYGYGTVTALRSSAASALDAGTIQVMDAQHVLTVTDDARMALDSAKAVNAAGDAATATGKLTMAMTIITQAQQFLAAKGVK